MSTGSTTPPMRRYNVYLTVRQIAELHRVYARAGILPAEQIRRALDTWLEAHSSLEPAPQSVRTRRRGRVQK